MQAAESPCSPQPARQSGRKSGGAPQSLTALPQTASQVDWMVYPGERGRSGVTLVVALATHSKPEGHSELLLQGWAAAPPPPPSSEQATTERVRTMSGASNRVMFMLSSSSNLHASNRRGEHQQICADLS